MNRIIKFRALVPVNTEGPKTMEFFDLSLVDDLNRLSYADYDIQGLMQFTGLKDKNGIEIFEGDIIRKDDPCYWVSQGGEEVPDADDLETWRGGTGYVVAIPFGYVIKEIDCGNWAFNGPEGIEWSEYSIEVIGNIHQHPDFIKETLSHSTHRA